MRLTFNRLVEKDLRSALSHYDDAVGPHLARRANFPSFPYHLIFRETADGARVLVLRHHHRHPDYGLGLK